MAAAVLTQPSSERRLLDGPAGQVEVLVERPAGPVQGFACIGHPHPLFGGTLENKVVATLARAVLAMGWIAVRPNFRGVGASAGEHDHGIGETDDFLHVIDTIPRGPQWEGVLPAPAAAPWLLAGFSFGTFVAARAAQALAQQGRAPRALVLVGAAAGKWAMPPVPASTIVIHGEVDETIPLADVYPWARACEVPVIVMPGADHFFHRRLTTLKRLVVQNVLGAAALTTLQGGVAASAGERNADE
jgi:alpha/beta superfamily hydrolase